MTGAVLKYSVLRLSLFVMATVVVWQLGATPVLAVLIGAVISLLLSYVLLRGPREEMAQALAARVSARAGRPARPPRRGRAQDEAAEDRAADAVHDPSVQDQEEKP